MTPMQSLHRAVALAFGVTHILLSTSAHAAVDIGLGQYCSEEVYEHGVFECVQFSNTLSTNYNNATDNDTINLGINWDPDPGDPSCPQSLGFGHEANLVENPPGVPAPPAPPGSNLWCLVEPQGGQSFGCFNVLSGQNPENNVQMQNMLQLMEGLNLTPQQLACMKKYPNNFTWSPNGGTYYDYDPCTNGTLTEKQCALMNDM